MDPARDPAAPLRVVIVGGGTAGWLAALMLGDSARRGGLPLALTVVESSRIPTIGVGEGTTAVFRQILQHFGFSEAEFVRETGATIKFGIRHRDWRRKGVSYDGPIDDPHRVVAAPSAGSWLDVYSVAAGRPVADTHLFRWLMDRGKSPYAVGRDGRLLPAGPFHHAFHFDQARVGAWLRRKATGVERIDAEVSGARRDSDTGDIAALVTTEGREIDGDFFIDCTGFRRRLIAGEMGAGWISYADILPVNRAMPFWLDLGETDEIAPYTLAWAQDAGWMWSIPTQERYGCGYVYSDAFLTPEQAQAEIEARLGRPIEPRADIRIDSGRLDRAWVGNCLALGLASSFLEPLEATSIHGTIVQLMIFSQFHLRGRTDAGRDAYNAAVARQVDDFRDFINLHYVSERADTPFWRHVAAERIGAPTRARLAGWAERMPAPADFPRLPGGFPHTEEQLHYPVLDGLGLLSRPAAKAEMAARPALRAHARRTAAELIREYRLAAGRTLGHRALLHQMKLTGQSLEGLPA